jgi:hypothetical protein
MQKDFALLTFIGHYPEWGNYLPYMDIKDQLTMVNILHGETVVGAIVFNVNGTHTVVKYFDPPIRRVF